MRQKRFVLAVALTLSVAATMAQTLNSAYFTDDYKFRHTMNPAFDNEQSYISIPALGNINISMQGNFGYDALIMNNPLAGQPGQKSMTTFLNPYIDNNTALEGFSTGNNRIVTNVGVTLLSAGFKGFGGYNTIELNSKVFAGVSLPYELFEFAKNTGNQSYNIGDISAGAQAYVELAFGHSRKFGDKLRAGAKVKLLFGAARADLRMEGLTADLSGANQWTIKGNATADMSMKGFSYQEETKDYNEANRGQYRRVNDVDVDGGGLGGFGLAVDLGAVYKINDDWTVSAALRDLGFISWSNDMQAKNTATEFEFNGFHQVNAFRHGAFAEEGDKYSDQLADFANLRDQGDQGGRTTGIGAHFNAGVEYSLPSYRKLTFGLLSSTTINGDYSWTEARLGANWKPLKWLDGGVNFAVGSFAASMGWVLNIHPKGYNFFIGMDHILGEQSKEGIPLSSNASLAMGMNITW